MDGVEIQTKYYQTGKGCVDACFDKTTGQFRYQNSKGEPMMVEVPKDKYAEAVNEFRRKILEGKVPGATNPDDASKYIKKGQLTYKQELNLCKPGNLATSLATAKIGAVTGTTIAPGVGTVIGIGGSLVGGLLGGAAIKAVGDHVREDDTVILSRLYNAVVVNLIYEYMLLESEIDVLVEKFDSIKPKEFCVLKS